MSEEIIIPVTLFAAIFGIAYLYFTTRNRERMALIEKGESAELFKENNKGGNWALKLGIMAIGISLGIFVAYLLSALANVSEDIAFPCMLFLFGGLGLVASHYIVKKEKE